MLTVCYFQGETASCLFSCYQNLVPCRYRTLVLIFLLVVEWEAIMIPWTMAPSHILKAVMAGQVLEVSCVSDLLICFPVPSSRTHMIRFAPLHSPPENTGKSSHLKVLNLNHICKTHLPGKATYPQIPGIREWFL